MFDATSKHEYHSKPLDRLSLSSQPFEILDHIVFDIEDPRDLVALALTSHLFYDIAYPHIEYRVLSCHISLNEIWDTVAANPMDACHFSHLDVDGEQLSKDEEFVDVIPSAWFPCSQKIYGVEDLGPIRLPQALSQMCNLVHFSWVSSVNHPQTDDTLVSTLFALAEHCPSLEVMNITMWSYNSYTPITNFEAMLSSIAIPATKAESGTSLDP
ncbi:hypothetical protein M422DRAFT_251951 [Sphaerobolus stellatus SS14]|uniref:F-box domain-containing protein n=1 Tax=Sphaerobolus stellatus (strain SS14) TaxID=990650 RepID=A0A0C9W140_SPHS4|nr:hypothetical protein M422DRAFT_251951 [Sphaerobolus stellatus SS14]